MTYSPRDIQRLSDAVRLARYGPSVYFSGGAEFTLPTDKQLVVAAEVLNHIAAESSVDDVEAWAAKVHEDREQREREAREARERYWREHPEESPERQWERKDEAWRESAKVAEKRWWWFW